MKHIAIGGISFCGSTLLSLVLGSLPGAMTIGDSKYLTEKWVDRSHKELGKHAPKITRANYDQFNQCLFCQAHKHICPYLTREFRAALQDDPREWYGKIARAFGTDCLVSSDKTPSSIKRLDPALEHDLLVSFKSPARARMSAKRADRNIFGRDLQAYLDRWSELYGQFVEGYDNVGLKLFLNFEAFARWPEEILKLICQLLDVKFSQEALFYWEHEHHYVGGNFHIYYNVMKKERRVEITPLSPLTLSEEEIQTVEAHTASRRIHARMLDHYQAAFRA